MGNLDLLREDSCIIQFVSYHIAVICYRKKREKMVVPAGNGR